MTTIDRGRVDNLLMRARLAPTAGDLFGPGHDPADAKLGAVVQPFDPKRGLDGFRAALVGFRCDIGVARNAGRVGAAEGPPAIRQKLYKLNATDARGGVDLRALPMVDLGDVVPDGKDLAGAQERLGAAVGACLLADVVPVVLGGGHETAYGHFLGWVEAGEKVAIANLDAHLDVRRSADGGPTSGTPFRQALKHPSDLLGGRYACVGAQPYANSPAYVEFVLERGGALVWSEEARAAGVAASFAAALELWRGGGVGVMASLDIDVVSSAFAPGCSATSPDGVSAVDFIGAAAAAGADPCVESFEISETAPPLDRDGQTARLAALAVHAFLCARAKRDA